MSPANVTVELYQGSIDATGEIVGGTNTIMEPIGSVGEIHRFEAGAVTFEASGKHGYTVRVLPHHPDLPDPHQMELIRWG
jgi:glycogen phosphorylase